MSRICFLFTRWNRPKSRLAELSLGKENVGRGLSCWNSTQRFQFHTPLRPNLVCVGSWFNPPFYKAAFKEGTLWQGQMKHVRDPINFHCESSLLCRTRWKRGVSWLREKKAKIRNNQQTYKQEPRKEETFFLFFFKEAIMKRNPLELELCYELCCFWL